MRAGWGLVGALIVALVGPSCAASRAPAPPAAARRAVIDLTFYASGPTSTVRFPSGIVLSPHATSAPAGAAISSTARADGVTLSGLPGGPSTVRVRALYVEPVGTDEITLELSGPGSGTTGVDVTAVPPRPGRPVHASVTGSRPRSVTAARSRLFGAADPAAPPLDTRRLVLATYYPWFVPSNEGDPTMADRPAAPDDATDAASVLAQTTLARAHGVDGFAVSWQGNQNLDAFRLVLGAAEQTGGVAAPFLETADANARHDPSAPTDPAVVEQFITEALATTGSPAFLRLNGVPVVFIYAMQRLAPPAWASIEKDLAAAGTPVALIGDGGWPTFTDVAQGWFLFNPNAESPDALRTQYQFADAVLRAPALAGGVDGQSGDGVGAGGPKVFAATVSPGRDDRRLRGDTTAVVPRGQEGTRYAAVWEAALAARPDWVLVNSWNEWFEDTQVDPGVATGSLALDQTAHYAAMFKASR